MVSPKSKLTKPIRKLKATWVEPQYFADSEYRDITSEGLLRASSFNGLSKKKPTASAASPDASDGRQYSRCDLRSTGLRISLSEYKVPNGKQNVTFGKRSPISSRFEPAILFGLRDDFAILRTKVSSGRVTVAREAAAHSLFTKRHKSPETTSPNSGSRSFTHALRRTGGK